MTDENNPEPTNNNDDNLLTKFKEIKDNYENKLVDKDKEIEELRKQLKEKDGEVNQTINDLNNEVNEKLAKAEELQQLQVTVNELLEDKAEALVDKYIHEGKIAPAQKEKALKLCLRDQEMFTDLYRDAPSIIDIKERKSKKPSPDFMGRLSNYFK